MPCFVKQNTKDQFKPKLLKFEPICNKGGFKDILKEFTPAPEKVFEGKREFKHHLMESDNEVPFGELVAAIDTSKVDNGVVKIEKYHGMMGVDFVDIYKVPEADIAPLVDIFNRVKEKQSVSEEQIIARLRETRRGEGRTRAVAEFFAQQREDAGANQQVINCLNQKDESLKAEKKGRYLYKLPGKCDLSKLKAAKSLKQLELDASNIHFNAKSMKEFVGVDLHQTGYTFRDVGEYRYTATRKLVFLNMKDGTQFASPLSFLPKRFSDNHVDSEIYNAEKGILESIPEIKELEKVGEEIIEKHYKHERDKVAN